MTDECIDPIELFKIEAYHEDTEVQIRAIKKLPTLAVALDVVRTRHELVSCLDEFLDLVYFQSDEILASLAEQLGKFSAFIGGAHYAHILFPMLDKLASTEDGLTREKAVESLQHIASLMDGEDLESHFIPLVRKLTSAEWFTSKCSAAGLYAICYPKLNEDRKTDLRTLFFRLLREESPMVRRAAVTNFAELVKIVEIGCLKTEFVPMFEELANDDQDSVRLLDVNVGISIASRFNTQETAEHVLGTLEKLSVDSSWRVRYQFANEINSLQTAVGPIITRRNLIHMYRNLVGDKEANIREISARKIVQFCEILQKTYEGSGRGADDLDPVIKNEIFPLIRELDQDVAEDVKDGLYSVITSLSSLLGEVNTKDFLLPLITSSLETGSPRVKENIIANLNNIICIVDINCLSENVRRLISELVNTSATFWRTRRNLIVTLSHMANHSKKEYFNEHLKPLYVKLLNDAVYGVRKVAPLIFPLLVKKFGVAWAKESIIPTFLDFQNHTYYLLRLMCLFGIDELISPTLQTGEEKNEDGTRGIKYLQNLAINHDNPNSSKILNKILILNEILQKHLQEEWVPIVLDCVEDDRYFHEDIRTYAEDTIEAFTKTGDFNILPINKYEIENQEEEESYLEGLLYLSIIQFLPIIHTMAQDKVVNVCLRAVNTLTKVIAFSNALSEELNQEWVLKILRKMPKNEVIKLKDDITSNLKRVMYGSCEKAESTETQSAKDRMVENSASKSDSSLEGEEIIFSREELSSIEQIILNHSEERMKVEAFDGEKEARETNIEGADVKSLKSISEEDSPKEEKVPISSKSEAEEILPKDVNVVKSIESETGEDSLQIENLVKSKETETSESANIESNTYVTKEDIRNESVTNFSMES